VPVLVSATGTANDAVFAAVFEQGITGSWFARHGMTLGPEPNVGTFQHQNKVARDGKMILRSMAIYGTPSDRRFIGVWHANPGYTKWHVHYADDGANYQTVFNAETSNPFYRPTEIARRLRPRDADLHAGERGARRAAHHREEWPDKAGTRVYLGRRWIPHHTAIGPVPVGELQQDVSRSCGAIAVRRWETQAQFHRLSDARLFASSRLTQRQHHHSAVAGPYGRLRRHRHRLGL
jgi:polyglycine hydrolase-like protein